MARALAGKRAWLTGLRREQSADRADVVPETTDDVHGLAKFAPLAWWTHDDVWRYLRQNDVPYNALHDRGYPEHRLRAVHSRRRAGRRPSIGALVVEHAEHKECGLHPPIALARVAMAERLP